jgi:hypothetical protein
MSLRNPPEAHVLHVISPFTSSATSQKVFSFSKYLLPLILTTPTRPPLQYRGDHQCHSTPSRHHPPYLQTAIDIIIIIIIIISKMSSNLSTTHQCAVCKEAAALLCPNCATGLDAHGQECKTYYCSKACQAKDWAAGHKLECKVAVDRHQLFRIGSLVQEAFYQSSKDIWFHGVSKVRKTEHLETADGPRLLVWRSERQDGDDFPAFPDDLIDEERDERAILASATSAVNTISSLVDDLAKGEFSSTTCKFRKGH